MRTIEHWIAGKPSSGTSDRTAPVFNPATGAQQAEVLLASDHGRRRGDRGGAGRLPGVVADLGQQAEQGPLRVP